MKKRFPKYRNRERERGQKRKGKTILAHNTSYQEIAKRSNRVAVKKQKKVLSV